MNSCTLAFAGLDIPSVLLLANAEELELRYVNRIDELSKNVSKNPCNEAFVKSYRAIESQDWEKAYVWYLFFLLFSLFAHRLYRIYLPYLRCLIRHRIQIVDFDDVSATVSCLQRNVDVLIVNNWWILPESIVMAAKHGSINIHPSKLPQYRGSLPTLWSLKHGDTESALSVMLLDKNVDTGNILKQIPFTITEQDTALDIEEKIEEIVSRELLPSIKDHCHGSLIAQKQDASLASTTAKYYPYMCINALEESAADIINKVLLYPYLWPLDCCFIPYNDMKISLLQIHRAKQTLNMKRGDIRRIGFKLYIQADQLLYARLFIDMEIRVSFAVLKNCSA